MRPTVYRAATIMSNRDGESSHVVFQRESPSLGVSTTPRSADPVDPTPEEWQWLLDNQQLVYHIARKDRSFCDAAVSQADILSFAAPTVFRAMRAWKEGRGNTLPTHVALCLSRELRYYRQLPHLFLTPKFRGLCRRPILFGPYQPAVVFDEPDSDAADLLDDIGEAFRCLPGRWRDILAGYFGFAGAERTTEELAPEYGVSRERVCQILHAALCDVATQCGLAHAPIHRKRLRLRNARNRAKAHRPSRSARAMLTT